MVDDEPILDTDDEQVVRSRKKKWKLRLDTERELFKKAVNTVEGRAAIWRILEMCQLYGASFTGDANHTFFREGQRNIGQRIHEMFTELPGLEGEELLHRMAVEAKQRQGRSDV